MNHEEPNLPDELVDQVAAYDEALANGIIFQETFASDDSTVLDPRLQKIQHCLRRLEKTWPRAKQLTGLPKQYGRFEIERELGRGTYGVVFLAEDPELDRKVALKLPHPEALLTEELKERFLWEGRAAAKLEHPNIVPVYEAGAVGAVGYIASAYCDGPTLSAWLKDRDELVSPVTAMRIVAALADAVAHAHERGVWHRDIKPSNILLAETTDSESPDGLPFIPRLTDFGLAKLAGGHHGTQTGTLIGTPSYMPPEQAKGDVKRISPASDVYSLGAVLYELLTGRPPFKAACFAETIDAVINSEPLSPRYLHPELPRDLETVCLKCLEKDPERRYRSPRQLAHELRCIQKGEPIQARPISTLQHLRRWMRRRPVAASLLGSSGLAIVAFLVLAVIYGNQLKQHNQALEDSVAREREASRQAQDAQRLAEEQEWLTRRTLYVMRMNAVQRAWDQGQYQRATQLLNACRPGPDQRDVRGLEWHLAWKRGASRVFSQDESDFGFLDQFALSSDGKRIVIGGRSSALTHWDVPNRTLLGTFRGHEQKTIPGGRQIQPVLSLAYSPDGMTIASGGEDSTIRLWSVYEDGEAIVLKGHDEAVTALSFATDGATLASASNDGTVCLWDLATNQLVRRIDASRRHLHTVAFSPQGELVVTAGWDKLITVWQTQTGIRMAILTGHAGPINAVNFSPDGRLLVSASDDKTVRLWDSADFDNIATITGHDQPIDRVSFSPDGRHLVSGDRDGEIKVWSAKNWQEINSRNITNRIFELAVAPDNQTVIVATGVDHLELHGLFPPKTKMHGLRAWCAAFAPDGKTIATGGEDGTVALWDAETGQRDNTLTTDLAAIHGLAFSPDGQTLAAGTIGLSVDLWDPTTARRRSTLFGHSARVDAVAFANDGQTLASGSWDRTVKIWDRENGTLLGTLKGHTNDVRSLAFSPDGTRLASGSDDQTIRIWETNTKELIRILQNDHKIRALIFLPDGRLLTGDSEGFIKIWDGHRAQARSVIAAHKKGVRCLAISPDGLTFVSGSTDAELKFWALETQQNILRVPCSGEVTGAAFSPDGKTIVATLYDGTVKFLSSAE